MDADAGAAIRIITSTAGGLIAGPGGLLVGNLVGSLINSALPGLGADFSLFFGKVTANAAMSAGSNLVQRVVPAEKSLINRDIQTAFRDAFCDSLYDIGGEYSFPSKWHGKPRDVPGQAVFFLKPEIHSLMQKNNPVVPQARNCMKAMEKAVQKEILLPLNPPKELTAADANLYLVSDTTKQMNSAFVDQVLTPFLVNYHSLMVELPDFKTHLELYSLDRTLVHMGELLKDRGPAWRAFNRMMLEEIHSQLQSSNEGQTEILSRLDILLSKNEPRLIENYSVNLAEMISHFGGMEKKLDENLSDVIDRLASQHKEVMARFDALFATSLRIETKMDRVLRILGDGRFVVEGAPPVGLNEPPAPGESPFMGMNFFSEDDTDLFFGREILTGRLISRLQQQSFLAVIGASGSGKSSVLRAGLLPALKNGEPLIDGSLPPAGSRGWKYHLMTPTAHPLDALATAFTSAESSLEVTRSLIHDLETSPDSLNLFVRRQQGKERIAGSGIHDHHLLVVDQFEELFTLCHNESERKSFVENLCNAVENEKGSPLLLIIGLRADFYAECARYPELRERMSRFQEYIGPMTSDELERAIEEPAQHNGWVLEGGLVNLILRDTGEEPGALPLLSHALLETWKHRRGKVMTLESYGESGGVRGAIAHTAETVYRMQLSTNQQDIARRIFLRLTELGEGKQDTRRRAKVGELYHDPTEEENVRAVLKVLSDARLVTIGEDTVEVAHEALIREWPTLREWLEEDREGLRVQRRLGEAASEWERLDYDEAVLYRGSRLAEGTEWAQKHGSELNQLEREFLTASEDRVKREEEERERHRQKELAQARALANTQRQRAIVFGVGLVLALVLGILSFSFYQQAQKNLGDARVANTQSAANAATAQANASEAKANAAEAKANASEANRQASIAHGRALAAQAQAMINENPPRALLLSLESVNVAQPPLKEAEQALIDGLSAGGAIPLSGHTGRITAKKFSPDGHWLVTASSDRTIQVWNLQNIFSDPVVLQGHFGTPWAVAFSPDGHWLATGGADKIILIWNMQNLSDAAIPLYGFQDIIWNLKFSPDNRWIAASGAETVIRLWDIHNLKENPITLSGHEQAIWDMDFSPDGRWLATSSKDTTTRLWDMQSLTAKPEVLKGHTARVGVLAFSPDGRWLATGSDDYTARLWDLKNLSAPSVLLTGHVGWITSLAFSQDGRWFATASDDGTAQVWNLKNLPGIPYELSGHSAYVKTIAFSPDSRWLVTGSYDDTARLWDMNNPFAQSIALSGHSDVISDAIFSPDGHWLALSGQGKNAWLWDIKNISIEPVQLLSHKGSIQALAISPDGHWLASGGFDRIFRLWNINNPTEFPRWGAGHEGTIEALAFSPDGHWLATGSADHTVRVWDVQNLANKPVVLNGYEGEVWHLAFSPDGRYLASAGTDITIRLWNMQNLAAEPKVLKGHTSNIQALVFSGDGHWLASGGMDGTIRLWDARKPNSDSIVLGSSQGVIRAIVFSPDSKLVASGSGDGAVRLWDINNPVAQTALLNGNGKDVEVLSFSHDGRWLASGSWDGIARLWDIQNPTLAPVVLRGHRNPILTLAFSHDDRWLATSGVDYEVRLWDVQNLSVEPLVLKGHTGDVNQVLFSQDDHWLFTSSIDQTIRIWDLNLNELMGKACKIASRNLTMLEWETYFTGELYRKTCEQWP